MLDNLDHRTAKEIDKRVKKLLKEVGAKSPPINLKDVVEFLMIHKYYYDLKDPSLLDEIKHKLHIGSKKALDIIQKVSLKALFLPDQNQIAIDNNVPKSKEKWVTAHEITHKILPTHNQLLIGDTAETLDQEYHDMMEREANYGASGLIFLQEKFENEALEFNFSIESVFQLSNRYKNSKTSTLRRFVETNKSNPIAALVSKPLWLNGTEDVKDRCRHYIQSPIFKEMFLSLDYTILLAIVDHSCHRCRGGNCGTDTEILYDINGQKHEFLFESFFNQHDILTLITHLKQK